MIIWATVWVLTVSTGEYHLNKTYQLTYSTQEICTKQMKKHIHNDSMRARCDFQQVPLVK